MTVQQANQYIRKIENLAEMLSERLRKECGDGNGIAIRKTDLASIRDYLYVLSDIYQRAEVKLP